MNLIVLGITGSIGQQVSDVAQKQGYNIIAMSAYHDSNKLRAMIEIHKPIYVSVYNKEDANQLKKMYPFLQDVFYGSEGLRQLAMIEESGMLVNAVVGFAGLAPTITAIEHIRDIALANKETLVVGGDLIIPLAKQHGVKIKPIDSEHSAIAQCIGDDRDMVDKIYITASGGGLRHYTREDLETVKKEDALTHPNWLMGAKITIDSATMMNKGLEIIEAHQLFGIDYSDIIPLLHDESIVHSMVLFKEGSMLAHLGVPDMRIPINYALSDSRVPFPTATLDLSKPLSLSFKPMDYQRFPLIDLSIKMGEKGGYYPCILNAANEVAVSAFLEEQISFLTIETLIIDACDHIQPPSNEVSLEGLYELDRMTRKYVLNKIKKGGIA
jgi:1-deoxy-D-xylulose-5-phosphate reductoisomerase